jgi:hypothetical protein
MTYRTEHPLFGALSLIGKLIMRMGFNNIVTLMALDDLHPKVVQYYLISTLRGCLRIM